MTAPSRSLRERLPLRPGTASGVLAAAVTLACAEFVRSGLYAGYLIPVIDSPQHMYQLPAAVGGFAWTTHLVTDTLMRGPAGLMLQRYGPRRVVLGGALLCLLALSLLFFVKSAWMLLLVAALHAVGFSPMWPATMNLTADAAKAGYEGRVLTTVSTAVMPLSGLGLIVYGAVGRTTDLLPVLMTLGVMGAGTLLSLLLPLRRTLTPVAVPEEGRPRLNPSVLPALLPLLPAALMQTLTQSLIGAWLIRIAPSFGLEYWQLIALLVVGGGVAFASMPLTGRVADQGRARLTVTIGYALVGLGMLGFTLLPPLWLLFVLAGVIGLGYAFLTPGWAALVAQTLPEAQRPAAWGMIMTVESAGTAAGPSLGGLALQLAGVRGPFALSGLMALVTALGYVIFQSHFQGAKMPASAEANHERHGA
ncbi:MFS transporter [Deinococcus navajonensis]|uniref:MFS transporter n=1 Tax=Deinococcus navajonensis TaxID=309884 RepID=A0ABV8XMS3_9DEIO